MTSRASWLGLRAFCFAALILLGNQIGCGDGLPDASWHGRYVHIATDTDYAPCAGAVEHYDRFVEEVFAFLGSDIPPDFRVDLYVLRPDTLSDIGIDPDAVDGVAQFEKRRLFVEHAFAIEHELVHVIAGTVTDSFPAAELYGEGLAVALGRTGPIFQTAWQPGETRSGPGTLLERDLASASEYDEAGRVARFLIDAYGIDAFLAAYVADGDPKLEFETAFGVTVDQAETAYWAMSPHCVYQLPECVRTGLPELPPGGPWTIERAVTCEQQDAAGARTILATDPDSDFSVVTTYRWTVLEASTYALSTNGALVLTRCGSCTEQRIEDLRAESSGQLDIELALAPGTYAVMLRGHENISVDVTRVGP